MESTENVQITGNIGMKWNVWSLFDFLSDVTGTQSLKIDLIGCFGENLVLRFSGQNGPKIACFKFFGKLRLLILLRKVAVAQRHRDLNDFFGKNLVLKILDQKGRNEPKMKFFKF